MKTQATLTTSVMVPLLAFLFGITTKYADLLNEHGLKPPFRGARLLSGIVWGVVGGALIIAEPHLAVMYLALVMYWIYKIKLDYQNHAIGGVIMLLVGFAYLHQTYYVEFVLLTCTYILSQPIHSYLKKRFPKERYSQVRFYLIPLAYSLIIMNFTPFFAACIGLAGVESVNFIHQRYERVGRR